MEDKWSLNTPNTIQYDTERLTDLVPAGSVGNDRKSPTARPPQARKVAPLLALSR